MVLWIKFAWYFMQWRISNYQRMAEHKNHSNLYHTDFLLQNAFKTWQTIIWKIMVVLQRQCKHYSFNFSLASTLWHTVIAYSKKVEVKQRKKNDDLSRSIYQDNIEFKSQLFQGFCVYFALFLKTKIPIHHPYHDLWLYCLIPD